jgi:hypothetical protein
MPLLDAAIDVGLADIEPPADAEAGSWEQGGHGEWSRTLVWWQQVVAEPKGIVVALRGRQDQHGSVEKFLAVDADAELTEEETRKLAAALLIAAERFGAADEPIRPWGIPRSLFVRGRDQ